jgi:hypothetical protein
MAITRDQFAVLNFGYITGLNLLQYCPEELLFQKYNTYQYLFQQAVNQAVADVKSRLSPLYDLNAVMSNANQFFKKCEGSLTVNFAAQSYVSQIFIRASNKDFPQVSIPGVLDVSSYVSVGTTEGGTDILDNQVIPAEGFLWQFNKYYSGSASIYFTLTGPALDIDISANMPGAQNVTPSSQLTANLVKDDLLMEIVSKLAIKKILGSAAGTNKQLQGIFEENDYVIEQILLKQRVLNLPGAKAPIAGVPFTASSSFKTIG